MLCTELLALNAQPQLRDRLGYEASGAPATCNWGDDAAAEDGWQPDTGALRFGGAPPCIERTDLHHAIGRMRHWRVDLGGVGRVLSFRTALRRVAFSPAPRVWCND